MNNSIKHWVKLLSITASAQIIVQALGFVCGILIIRLLPVDEYALYVLANTMLGTMTVLADGGISQGVMAEGAKVWQDKEKLGIVLATGLDLRRKFAIGSLLLTTPILLYLLIDNGAGWLTASMISLSLIPAFYSGLSDTLLQIVPKLHQNIIAIQKNQLQVGIGRLVLIFLTVFIFPITFVALLANGVPRIFGNIRLYKIADQHIKTNQKPSVDVRKRILQMVKRIMPGAIYYAFSGQLIIWLASIFGNTTSIAQLGALGRFNLIFSLFIVLIQTLIIPRFARLEAQNELLKRFLQILAIIILIMLTVLLGINIFSSKILWILGDNYRDLDRELLLVIVAGILRLLSQISFSLYTSRGWALNPSVIIILNISAIIMSIFLFDIYTLVGLLYLNIAAATTGFLINGLFCYYRLVKIK